MDALQSSEFPAFIDALYEHAPYPWQMRLAARLCDASGEDDGWHDAIDLPTGSGKTSCLDAAVFAMAVQAGRPVGKRTARRRIVFCVNRRVIVSSAYRRAQHIAGKLLEAEEAGDEHSILFRVASALRELAGTETDDTDETGGKARPPLDAIELRGGVFRDDRWASSPTQPTVIASTVDQLGSRLLFRGYGVSDGMRPIHAGLLAHDTVVLLDEAHISRPFLQTLHAIQRYARSNAWFAETAGPRALTVVPMTATPPPGTDRANVLRLTDEDRAVLASRLGAEKSAELVYGNEGELTKRALSLAHENGQVRAVGVIVNRVTTAKAVYDALLKRAEEKKHTITAERVHLVIGAMRPIDRDRQMRALEDLVGPDRPETLDQPAIVVATQCLEVGADYDFDAMVTQCASLDALRQRFGRLNRAGRPGEAPAVILHEETKETDPIYGDALEATWAWLKRHAEGERIDMGINAMEAALKATDPADQDALMSPGSSLDAPLLLPAHLDLLCHTNPSPAIDPDVSLYLHGPERGMPQVNVCWRADLPPDRQGWAKTIDLLPPTSAECMPVPLKRFREWLNTPASETRLKSDDSGDAPGRQETLDDDDSVLTDRSWLPWRHASRRSEEEEKGKTKPRPPKPNDTIVLRADDRSSWSILGHIPPTADGSAPPIDIAEQAALAGTDRAVIRLHAAFDDHFPERHQARLRFASDDPADDLTTAERRELMLSQFGQNLLSQERNRLKSTDIKLVRYPISQPDAFLLISRRLELQRSVLFTDDDTDAESRSSRQLLDDHTNDVVKALKRSLDRLPLSECREALLKAADLHDQGKLDPRFQAYLFGRSDDEASLWLDQSIAWAKSGSGYLSPSEQHRDRCRAGLPKRFRHEELSVQLAEANGDLGQDNALRALVLHLIASHHGYARPFAPVPAAADEHDAGDPDAPAVRLRGEVLLTAEQRQDRPPHRLDAGVPERFWLLTRRYGWWGLTYLESILRLADQQASGRPVTFNHKPDEECDDA